MSENPEKNEGYRVLARKYRPSNFDELIGQDSLVKTLSNALSMGRLAHAFILTGLRGIGKTTTARIIARGLNCVGADGNGGPTLSPCGVCSSCTGIADGRHVDEDDHRRHEHRTQISLPHGFFRIRKILPQNIRRVLRPLYPDAMFPLEQAHVVVVARRRTPRGACASRDGAR